MGTIVLELSEQDERYLTNLAVLSGKGITEFILEAAFSTMEPVERKEQCRMLGFDEFWEKYPKKRSRGQAERTWKKLNPSIELLQKILAALEKAKQSKDWKKDNGQFIPHASTWLNAKGWEDEFEKGSKSWNQVLTEVQGEHRIN